MNVELLLGVKPNPNIPEVVPGDTVKVRAKVVEGDRERVQAFQGVVIKVRHGTANANFTVRRVAYGVGVERTFFVNSPLLDGVEVIRHGKVRRAKLHYLRGRSGKASRLKERRFARTEKQEPELEPASALEIEPEPVLEPEAELESAPEAEQEPKAELGQEPESEQTQS